MITHDGYTIRCDGSGCEEYIGLVAQTERTAVKHARDRSWFVGHIRITRGHARSKIRTVERSFCPGCKWLVGL